MNLRIAFVVLIAASLCTGCSDDSDQSLRGLTILVTNDDGVGASGIDTLVNTLIELDNVEVKVVAPAENQSGASDKTTEGEVVWNDSSTTSGYMAVAVYGYPADSVKVALEVLDIAPDLVVSGVNEGQNVGPLAALSGTVGAARFAARAGFPAVAVSAGFGTNADNDAASALVAAWIEDNRNALASSSARADVVISFNVPGCTAGAIRELVDVPLADSVPEGTNPFFTDCSVEPDGAPINDVDGIIKGYATVTEVPLEF